MGLPANRVTRSRVLLLAAITLVALAFGTFRWSTDSSSGSSIDAAVDPTVATAASTALVATGRTRGSFDPHTAATPEPDPTSAAEAAQLLACLRMNESNNTYSVVSPSGAFFGAYQFDQQTWNNTAEHAGRPGLAGVQPNLAAPADQDDLALALLQWQGTWPWNGDPCV